MAITNSTLRLPIFAAICVFAVAFSAGAEEPAAEEPAAEEPASDGPSSGGDYPEMLRPVSGKTMFFGASLGAGARIDTIPGQFKLQQEFGYYAFDGDLKPLALGVAMGESFGSGGFIWQLRPKVWYDFQPLDGLGLHVSPFFNLGLALLSGGGNTNAFFSWGFGVQGRLAIAGDYYVMLQPLAFDFFHGSVTGVRYDFLIGGGMYL